MVSNVKLTVWHSSLQATLWKIDRTTVHGITMLRITLCTVQCTLQYRRSVYNYGAVHSKFLKYNTCTVNIQYSTFATAPPHYLLVVVVEFTEGTKSLYTKPDRHNLKNFILDIIPSLSRLRSEEASLFTWLKYLSETSEEAGVARILKRNFWKLLVVRLLIPSEPKYSLTIGFQV